MVKNLRCLNNMFLDFYSPLVRGNILLVYIHQVSVPTFSLQKHWPPTRTLLDPQPQGSLNAGAPGDPSNFIMLGLILQSSWPAAAS